MKNHRKLTHNPPIILEKLHNTHKKGKKDQQKGGIKKEKKNSKGEGKKQKRKKNKNFSPYFS